MPVLSQYWFNNGYWSGPFTVYNVSYPNGGWAWISGSGTAHGTLVWNREDGEHVIGLQSQLDTAQVHSVIDNALGSQAQRTSGVMVQGVPWTSVPYYSQNPARHPASMMLVRVYFNFHVGTPWYCSDANGSISYYLAIYLDGNGHVSGYVDGDWYQYDGGGPFCTGAINDALNSAVPGAVGQVNTILQQKLALLSGLHFSKLYFLPGSGTTAGGGHAENADTDLAVAVLS